MPDTLQYSFEPSARGYSLLSPDVHIHFHQNLFDRLRSPSRCLLLGLRTDLQPPELSVISLRVLTGETAEALSEEVRRLELGRLQTGTRQNLEVVGLFWRRSPEESDASQLELGILREHFARGLFVLLTQNTHEPERCHLQCSRDGRQLLATAFDVPQPGLPDLHPAPVGETLAALSKSVDVDITKVVRPRRPRWVILAAAAVLLIAGAGALVLAQRVRPDAPRLNVANWTARPDAEQPTGSARTASPGPAAERTQAAVTEAAAPQPSPTRSIPVNPRPLETRGLPASAPVQFEEPAPVLTPSPPNLTLPPSTLSSAPPPPVSPRQGVGGSSPGAAASNERISPPTSSGPVAAASPARLVRRGPLYLPPEALRAFAGSVTVVVEVTVDERGRARKAVPRSASGVPAHVLNAIANEVQGWEYAAGIREGRPVEGTALVAVSLKGR